VSAEGVIKHHPAPETLTAFAAGTLRAGFDFVTAVHVRGCAECRAEVARLEALGGVIIDSVEAAAPDTDALARVMARIEAPLPASPAPRSMDQVLRFGKRRWVAPGVWTAKVETPHAKDDRVYVLSVAPGVEAALHTHRGAEFTQVMSGALGDGTDVLEPGDFSERGPDHTHRPKVLGDAPCVCLFATQGRLTPKDLIGRIAFAIADV
jgi:putative transcriptional regulator